MKEQIVVILSNLIREKGYAALSISDIAEATQLSKSSLYHHFPRGKVEMAEAVLATTISTLSQKFSACLND